MELIIDDAAPEMADATPDMALITPDMALEIMLDMVAGKPAIAEATDEIAVCSAAVIDEAADAILEATSDTALPSADWMLSHKLPRLLMMLSLTNDTKLLIELTIQLDTLLITLLNQSAI
ncbi:MAG: hypothetical protein QW407_03425 [Thermofilaceae archaeon]